MKFNKFDNCILKLKNEDNEDWIDKVSCWGQEEKDYIIYIFQVSIKNEMELENYHEAIAASIAVDFQANLDKAIEKWNIYLVFQCTNKISEELKEKIEQDKYSTRKFVWDGLEPQQIGDGEYLRTRLLSLDIDINEAAPKNRGSLIDLIRKVDPELFLVLENKDNNVKVKEAIYLGGKKDE